ncbi:VPS9 domain [Trinorchestia longiramus]|nr:VPS9 domain [Trinorchestia longiramus]
MKVELEGNMTDDVLAQNAFFQHLQKNYAKKLKKWREPEWRICVPSNEALNDCESFSQQFIESHALHQTSKPGEFTSLGCGKSVTYILKENELIYNHRLAPAACCSSDDERQRRLSTTSHQFIKVNVLNVYLETVEDSLVHILLISATLDPTPEEELSLLDHLSSVHVTTNEEAEQFLHWFSCHHPVLELASTRLSHWQVEAASSQPLPELQTQLHDVLLDCWDDIIRRHSPQWQTNKMFQDLLYNALDFVVVWRCHSVVWWRVREKCGNMDDLVSLRLNHLRTACFTSSQLQLPELCEINTPAAVVELAALGNLESAISRLHSMHAAIELLQAHAKQARAELESYTGPADETDREECPSSVSEEELLGLLTMAIIEAQCPHLVSNLYYTSHFVFSLPDHHPLRDSGSSVKTALRGIMQLDITEILKTPTKPPIRKEMSLLDLMKITNAVEQRFERPRRHDARGEDVEQRSPNISSLDLYYQQLTDRLQRSTMESSSIDPCPRMSLYTPLSEESISSPYTPLGSPLLPHRTAQAGLVNSIVEFFSAFPSSIRASLRRKQTERREAVVSATEGRGAASATRGSSPKFAQTLSNSWAPDLTPQWSPDQAAMQASLRPESLQSSPRNTSPSSPSLHFRTVSSAISEGMPASSLYACDGDFSPESDTESEPRILPSIVFIRSRYGLLFLIFSLLGKWNLRLKRELKSALHREHRVK